MRLDKNNKTFKKWELDLCIEEIEKLKEQNAKLIETLREVSRARTIPDFGTARLLARQTLKELEIEE